MRKHRPILPTVVAAAVVVRAERAAPEPKSTASRRRSVVDRPHQSHLTQARSPGTPGRFRGPATSADGACSVIFSYDFFHMKVVFSRGLRPRLWKRVYAGPNGPYERQYIEPTPQRNPSMPAVQLPCLPDAHGIWCAPTSSYENTARFFIHPGSIPGAVGTRLTSRSESLKMLPTPGSNVVTHRSTSWAGTCLTSLS